MKKTVKLMSILLTMVVMFTFGKVYAHNIELDPERLITLPFMIYNGKGTISISSAQTNYKLYYQAVEISDSVYTQIKEIQSSGEAELNVLKEEIDEMKDNLDELKAEYDEKYEEYNTIKNDTTKSETEIQAAKDAYEEAQTNYNNAGTAYNAKVKAYNARADELNENITELIPEFNDSNWIETSDGSMQIDLSQFSGKKTFAAWVKLVTADGKTYYDETVYTVDGNKKDSGDSSQPSQESSGEEAAKEAQNGKKDETVADKEIPQTGTLTYVVAIAIGTIAVVGIIANRRSKRLIIK